MHCAHNVTVKYGYACIVAKLRLKFALHEVKIIDGFLNAVFIVNYYSLKICNELNDTFYLSGKACG